MPSSRNITFFEKSFWSPSSPIKGRKTSYEFFNVIGSSSRTGFEVWLSSKLFFFLRNAGMT